MSPVEAKHGKQSLTGDANASQSGEEDANMLRNGKFGFKIDRSALKYTYCL
jgi:hypothetical protein